MLNTFRQVVTNLRKEYNASYWRLKLHNSVSGITIGGMLLRRSYKEIGRQVIKKGRLKWQNQDLYPIQQESRY